MKSLSLISLFLFLINVQASFALTDLSLINKFTNQTCQNRPLGNDNYWYQITGDNAVYSMPANKDGNNWVIRESAVTFSDKIFTLPFKQGSIRKNGWLYSKANWHYAIDYFVAGFNQSFEVYPAADGKVIFVGWDNWSGNSIVISHDANGVKDAYRTIYMHLRNGPVNDCNNAWNRSLPSIAKENDSAKFRNHLTETGCAQNANDRQLQPLHWGTPQQRIRIKVGDFVTTQQSIGFAGNTGPGGQIAAPKPTDPNLHLHIFFARRDSSNNKWYLIDPYGIYGEPSCYPRGITDRISQSVARYSIAWKNDTPQIP